VAGKEKEDTNRLMVTLSVDELRAIVKEEIASANGNAHPTLLTAEQLAAALQVHKATVYQWVKDKSIPYYHAGRFVRFNLQEVLESQRKIEENPLDKL